MILNIWQPILKLFNSLVTSTLFMFAIQVWGLRFLEEIENIQTRFYKRLLLDPKNTTSYAIRLEVGAVKLASRVFKLSLNLIEKI